MKNVIHFVRRSAAALIAALVVCSAHAATVPSSCNPAAAAADGVTLLRTCTPEITFYLVATEDFNANVTNSWLTTNMVKVLDASKPIVTINLAGNTTANAFYGYGVAGASFAGQRVAVIINGTNGYISGLKQLLTGLKSGSSLNGVDGQEYKTIQLHTAAEQKAGRPMPATDVTVTTASALRPLVTLSANRIADFKTGWGMDKQKVAHMAMSEFRPSEAPSGLLSTWSAKTFPAETFAMRGYGVIVNTNMYKALMARDVREGRIRDASCNSSDDSVLLAKCQPTVFTHDYKSLMTAKTTSAAVFLNNTQETRVLNLNRLPITSGAQTAAQISFADQANYLGKYPLAVGLDAAGAESATAINGVWTATEEIYNPSFKVYTNHTGLDLLKKVNDDQQNLSIGVVGFWPLKSNYPNAHWVKLDGQSPNYYQGDTEDLSLRVGLQTGYPLAYEFQFIKSANLAGSYLDIYNRIVEGFKDVANSSAPGVAYINSTDATKNTPWTRGGNNLFGLNRTAAGGTPVPCSDNCDSIVNYGGGVSGVGGGGGGISGGGVSGGASNSIVVSSFATGLNSPHDVLVDINGNIYISDSGNNRIVKFSPSGAVAAFPGGSSSIGYSWPLGLAVDLNNNIYVADSQNRLVRKITQAGYVSTIATDVQACGLAVDKVGNVFIADCQANIIRKVATSGVMSTYAGNGTLGNVDGPSASATFAYPSGVTLDTAGNLFVVDQQNFKIRKISSKGVVSTFAGSGYQGSADGNGASASFTNPVRMSMSADGTLYLADGVGNKIRKITPTGTVSTVAGNGSPGISDGSTPSASFANPRGISVDANGNIYVADTGNNSIRKIKLQ